MIENLSHDPEIWRIHVGLPKNTLRALNSYVIRDAGESLIIDTGFRQPQCRAALWGGIRELGLDLARTSLFLTHLHSDHIGLVQDFVEQGCAVYMSAIDYDYFCLTKSGAVFPYMEQLFLAEGFPRDEYELARQTGENQGRRYSPKWVFPATAVTDGDTLRLGAVDIRCVHVPGHTPGSMALYLPKDEILFSGDHILFEVTPHINVWKNTPHSLADYISSLKKARALSIRRTMPSHGMEHGDVYARIDQLLNHHRVRLEEIQQIVIQNPGASAYQIAGRMHWSYRKKLWEEFPPHQKWFSVGETLAHLYWLADHGFVRRKDASMKVSYEAIV